MNVKFEVEVDTTDPICYISDDYYVDYTQIVLSFLCSHPSRHQGSAHRSSLRSTRLDPSGPQMSLEMCSRGWPAEALRWCRPTCTL